MIVALLHVVLIVAYATTGYLAAGEIGLRVPEADVFVGYGAGALLFLLLSLAHFAIAQLLLNVRLRREIEYIAYESQEMADHVATARREVSELSTLASDGDVARSNIEIVSEMRILRSLITQLNVKRGQGGANRTGTAKNDALTDNTAPLATPLPSNLSTNEVLDITRRALEDNRVDLYIPADRQLAAAPGPFL